MIDSLVASDLSFVSLGSQVPNKEQHFFQSHSGRAQTGTDTMGFINRVQRASKLAKVNLS